MVTDVQAYFTANSVTANVSLGWRERTKQVNQGPGRANRVVFTPSDESGAGGEIVAPQHVGPQFFGTAPNTISARALFDWERLVTVSVWAVDTTSPADEGKQIEAVEDLFEWVVRAVQYSRKDTALWGSVKWTVAPTELMFGRELVASLTLRHPLFDAPRDIVYPKGHVAQNPPR